MNNKPKIAIIAVTIFSILFLSACSSSLNGNKTGEAVDINTRPSDQTQTKDTDDSKSVAENSAITPADKSNTDSEAASSTGQAENTTIESQKPQQTNGLQLSPSIKDIKVKAVYLTGPSGGSTAKVDKIIELAKTTEINTVVLDIKEDGSLNYQSNLDVVKKYGAETKYYNPEELVKKFHDNGIYVIGRIVTFRDKTLAKKRADLGIKTPKGTLWLENGKDPWTNPYFEEVWDYNIAIAKEAVSKGFDEIQFDYVRFPTGRKNDFDYGTNVPAKSQAINGFLAKAEKEIHQELGVPVSADVFAIIIESKSDGNNIGQIIEEVGKDIYCISPMIYPSHYANASNGVMGNGVGQTINGIPFAKPDLEPYKVMYNALIAGKKKIAEVPDYKAKVRPYIQAFTAKYLPKGYYQTYGPKQIREQISAVYDAGYDEWILWDSGNKYQEAYFEKK
ncbi:putative glycoside hydrolase [Ruminiclostridium herbifermentans]|uniref:Putative glycoside hydrolase n=1 Tax=Ruminiclostridium herbifermentans TaxID=2488810 RepID=A0A4U7JAD0_9FIRM|nr:putative glycoside hydrolase [Ruminiclostridium herbifermentans]QNU68120.1 putative glycoside hydrolase [Ruminiclostridium herbifermentans]